MPWKAGDAKGHTGKADTPEKQKQWMEVANSALQKCLDDGGEQDVCEASAIKQANGVIAKESEIPTVGNLDKQEPPETCICPDCGHKVEKERGTPCRSVDCPECGVKMVAKIEEEEVEEAGKRLNAKQIANLQAAAETIQGILKWAGYEDGEEPAEEAMSEFAESASGRAVRLVEHQGSDVVPLHMEVALIEPGFGNKRDNHYYPKDVLERDANVFAGVKMYESDHGNNKDTRMWVSTIKEIKGFTESGAPIGLVSIHDPSFATRIMALNADGLLDRMECSILANGKARKGEVEGRKTKIVESITEAFAVDYVTRAGAGGRALSLVESEEGTMDNEQIEETAPEEDVTLNEEESPQEEPTVLEKQAVQEALGKTNLPAASKTRLSESDYQSEDELTGAIAAEVEYVKALTGSGRPFAQGKTSAPELTPEQLREARDTGFDRIMRQVGLEVK